MHDFTLKQRFKSMSKQPTPEQIAQFRQLQKMHAELSIGLISEQKKDLLLHKSQELSLAGNDKNQIILILSREQNLSPEEIRALEGIL